jgi:hypothetical protein
MATLYTGITGDTRDKLGEDGMVHFSGQGSKITTKNQE